MKLKGKVGWIIGIIETIIGFTCFLGAQIEILCNSRYTWRKPYTSYEIQVLMIKWTGIIFLISGIAWFCLKVYQVRYTDKHTQDVNSVVKKGGIIKCLNCGLSLTEDAERCPRCGKSVKGMLNNSVQGTYFCSKCGNSIKENELYCTKCGHKIIR